MSAYTGIVTKLIHGHTVVVPAECSLSSIRVAYHREIKKLRGLVPKRKLVATYFTDDSGVACIRIIPHKITTIKPIVEADDA